MAKVKYRATATLRSAKLITDKEGKRIVRATFSSDLLEGYGKDLLHVKGQTFNIGPVKRLVQKADKAIVFVNDSRYEVEGQVIKV